MLRLLDIPTALLSIFVTWTMNISYESTLRSTAHGMSIVLSFANYKTDLCLSRNAVVIRQPNGTIEVANDPRKLAGAGLAF